MASGPQNYLEPRVTHKSFRFGGRYINLSRLSEDLAMDNGYISRILRGERANPTIEYLTKIAKALAMSVPDLLTCIEEKKEDERDKYRPSA